MTDTDPIELVASPSFEQTTTIRSLRSASLPFRATAGGAKGFAVELREDARCEHVAALMLRATSRVCSWSGGRTRSMAVAFGGVLKPGSARLYVIEHAGADGVTLGSATLEQDDRVAVSALVTFSPVSEGVVLLDDLPWEDPAVQPLVRGGWTTLPGHRLDEAAVVAALVSVGPPEPDVLQGQRAGDLLVLNVAFTPPPTLNDAAALVRWRVRSIAGGAFHEDGELWSAAGQLLARSSMTRRCHPRPPADEPRPEDAEDERRISQARPRDAAAVRVRGQRRRDAANARLRAARLHTVAAVGGRRLHADLRVLRPRRRRAQRPLRPQGHALAGLGVYAAANLAAGFAGSADALIAVRAVSGLGAAMIFPSTLSIITNVYTDRQARARAIGAWGAISGAAVALGPIVGGSGCCRSAATRSHRRRWRRSGAGRGDGSRRHRGESSLRRASPARPGCGDRSAWRW